MKKPEVGDIQTDPDGSEWIVIFIPHRNISRVRRYSLAHQIHAQNSEVIAKSLK